MATTYNGRDWFKCLKSNQIAGAYYRAGEFYDFPEGATPGNKFADAKLYEIENAVPSTKEVPLDNNVYFNAAEQKLFHRGADGTFSVVGGDTTIAGVTVDDTDIADEKVLQYDSTSDTYKHISLAPTSGASQEWVHELLLGKDEEDSYFKDTYANYTALEAARVATTITPSNGDIYLCQSAVNNPWTLGLTTKHRKGYYKWNSSTPEWEYLGFGAPQIPHVSPAEIAAQSSGSEFRRYYAEDVISLVETVGHNDLQSLDTGDYQHLTAAERTDLTDAGASTAHYHTSDRDRANHSGTQAASTISDFDTEVANNTTVAAATAHVAITSANPHGVESNDITDFDATAVVAAKTVKLDDFATPEDNTDLNATTSLHGLLPKLGGGTTNFLRADGTWTNPPGGESVHTDNVTSSGVGTPTDVTLTTTMNNALSPTCRSGGAITDNGDGTIDIAEGEYFIRSGNSLTASLVVVKCPAIADLAPDDNTTSYIYVDYNAGTPTYGVVECTPGTAQANWDWQPFAAVTRVGNDTHLMPFCDASRSFIYQFHLRTCMVNGPATYGHGLTVSHTGTRNIGIAAGSIYKAQTIYEPISAFDTSATDSFTYIYDDGASGWTRVASQTAISNTSYDDGSGTLASLGIAKFGVGWLYIVLNNPNELVVVYGRNTYSLSEAQEVGLPPTLPPEVAAGSTSILIGKIIIQQGGSSFTEIQSPFISPFVSTSVNIHNDLSGLDGGATDEYYHLTAAEHTSNATTATKLDDFATPDDNTDLNATTLLHGLLPKLGGGTTNYLRADGSWASPAGSGEGDVVGPSSATDNGLARFNATTGKLIQDTPVTVSDTGRVAVTSSSTDVWDAALTILNSAMADSKNIQFQIGKSQATNEAFDFTFYNHTTAADNYAIVGMYGSSNIVLKPGAKVNIGGTTSTQTEIFDVTGNMTISGTVDGRDIAADGTTLDAMTAGIPATTVDAKGDILAATANDTVTRLAVGTNDYVLMADSTEATGMKWAASAGGFSNPLTTRGDIIIRDTSDTVRLALGTNGQVLTSDGTDIAWDTPSSSVWPITIGAKGNQTGTYAIDMDGGLFQTITATGNISLSVTNTTAGQSKTVTAIITASGAARTLTFPAAWDWPNAPTGDQTIVSSGEDLCLTIVTNGTQVIAAEKELNETISISADEIIDGSTNGVVSLSLRTDLIAHEASTADPHSTVSDTAYSESTWNGVTDRAPSKNAVRDKIESMSAGATEGTAVLSTGETGAVKYLREDGDGTCSWQTPSGSGDVTGPASSTDNVVCTFSSTTGKVIQGNSTVTLSDAEDFASIRNIGYTGTPSGNGNGLTDGATITPNCDSGDMMTVTLGGNRTLALPSNIKTYSTWQIEVKQDATGSRTLNTTAYKSVGGTDPVLTTTASATDILTFACFGSTSVVYIVGLNDLK